MIPPQTPGDWHGRCPVTQAECRQPVRINRLLSVSIPVGLGSLASGRVAYFNLNNEMSELMTDTISLVSGGI